MFSEEVLTRLRQLNQQHVPLVHTHASTSHADPISTPLPADDAPTEDVSRLPHGQECHNAWGTHWIRRRLLSEIWPHGTFWLESRTARRDSVRLPLAARSRELRALLANLPDKVIYLDLETCGFSGNLIFLAGLIYRCNGQFQLLQLLARNYAEEKPMLQTLWSLLADHTVLATFNGKSFDWPLVHDRSTRHHLGYDSRHVAASAPALALPTRDASQPAGLTRRDPRPQLIHCDLLHHARRRWKGQLPNFKLQTLERHVCRRHRDDDIPGRAIPAAYHDFVRSGDAWLMRSVLHHNALDLVTLLQLSICVLE